MKIDFLSKRLAAVALSAVPFATILLARSRTASGRTSLPDSTSAPESRATCDRTPR